MIPWFSTPAIHPGALVVGSPMLLFALRRTQRPGGCRLNPSLPLFPCVDVLVPLAESLARLSARFAAALRACGTTGFDGASPLRPRVRFAAALVPPDNALSHGRTSGGRH